MPIRVVKTSGLFEKRYRKLPREVKERAKEKEKIFRNNPFDPRLRTHKLQGKYKDSWAFWIDYTHRIKFIFLNEGEVLFLDVGTHDMYR